MGIPQWLAQGISSFRQLPLIPTRKSVRHPTRAPKVKQDLLPGMRDWVTYEDRRKRNMHNEVDVGEEAEV